MFLHKLDAAQLVSNGSPAPAMPLTLAVDGKKLLSRFFQLRGSWVQEVALAARSGSSGCHRRQAADKYQNHLPGVCFACCSIRFLLPSFCGGP